MTGMSTFNEADHPRDRDGTFTEKTNSAPEATLARPLNEMMEIDHVVTVHADGTIGDGPDGLYAPDVYADDDDPFWGDPGGWKVLRGFTGQHGYRGHVLHPSEFIGGSLETYIRANPGHYVAVEVRDDEGGYPDGDPVGWAVAFKPLDLTCAECGEEMALEGGVSHHLLPTGDIDYDADADHVPLSDASYGVPRT